MHGVISAGSSCSGVGSPQMQFKCTTLLHARLCLEQECSKSGRPKELVSIAAGPESAVNPQSKLRTTMSKKKDAKEEEEEVWNVWEPWAPSPSNIAPKDLDYLLLRGLRSLLHITFNSELHIILHILLGDGAQGA